MNDRSIPRTLLVMAFCALLATLAACSSGSKGGGVSTAQFCKDATAVSQAADSSDPSKAAAGMTHLRDEAPAELKDDLTVIVDSIKSAGSGGSTNDAAVSKADSHMSTWVDAHC